MHNKDKQHLIDNWTKQIGEGQEAEYLMDLLNPIFDKIKKDLYNLWLERVKEDWDYIFYMRKALDELYNELKRRIENGRIAQNKIKEVLDGE